MTLPLPAILAAQRAMLVLFIFSGLFSPLSYGEEPGKSSPAVADAATTATIREVLLDPVDGERDRTVPLRVYLPAGDRPSPVVLFSHGLGGSRDNNPYLGRHWAQNGYVAVFMQHHGSDEPVWRSADRSEIMAVMKKAASLQSSLDRNADVPFVLDQLEKWSTEKDHPLAGRLDLEYIGMSGHSFGAVTTLALSGQKNPLGRDFGDARIDAFLPLSPQPGKGLSAEKAFGHIVAPVLCMTGTEDDSPIDPGVTPETRREVYQGLHEGDKYQLVFEGGHHFTFGDSDRLGTRGRNAKHHSSIQEISTKFWDAYLKGDSEAKEWLQSEAPREACDLDAKDVWQWK